jgi:hypothetical protein
MGSVEYAKFLQDRMQEYRDFFQAVGAAVKPAP